MSGEPNWGPGFIQAVFNDRKTKMKPLAINVNSEFAVTLTTRGASLYNAYYWQFPVNLRPPVLKAGDILHDTLWHLMVIFGPHINNGCEVPFENNAVTLTELR